MCVNFICAYLGVCIMRGVECLPHCSPLIFWDGLTLNWELINPARLETNKRQRLSSLFPPHCWDYRYVPIICEWWDPNSGPRSYTAKHFIDWNVTSAPEGPSLEKGLERWQVTEAEAVGAQAWVSRCHQMQELLRRTCSPISPSSWGLKWLSGLFFLLQEQWMIHVFRQKINLTNSGKANGALHT